MESEVTESDEFSIEEEKVKEDAYIPGDIDGWVKPENIDKYVGTYEGERDKETITLTITEEGYFTVLWQKNADNHDYYYFDYLSGVITTEFNDVNLEAVASLYHYNWPDWNVSKIFDEDGNLKNFDINGEIEELDKYSMMSSNPQYQINQIGSIWFDSIPLTNIDESIFKPVQCGQFNLVDSDHARIKFKSQLDINLTRIATPSEMTKQSVFQYTYNRLREMKNEKIENKYHLFQLLNTRRELSSELLYDSEVDKYLNYTGYDKSGNQLKMQFIVVEYDPYFDSTAYGYDGEKIYEGPIDEELKTINWEEYELPKDKVLKHFEG